MVTHIDATSRGFNIAFSTFTQHPRRIGAHRQKRFSRRVRLLDGLGFVFEVEFSPVTRYNLAYINHAIYTGDNGRVLGYDNAHGVHHQHRTGRVENVDFVSFEDIEARFEREWSAIGGT